MNVIELNIPPLRERPEDIDILAHHILERIAAAGDATPKRLAEDARNTLSHYAFAGNVRELENILERAVALSDKQVLERHELRLPQADPESPSVPASVMHAALSGAHKPLEDQLDEIQRQAILEALDATRWNRTAAAKLLGMSPRSLRYRLSKLGLD